MTFLLIVQIIIFLGVNAQSCDPPMIRDTVSMACYDNPSNCGQLYYDRINSQCVKSCPQGFSTAVDSRLNVNICVVPDQWTLWGRVFLCDFPYVRYLSGVSGCLRSSEVNQCDLYYVKDKNGYGYCLNDCPNSFTSGTDTVNNVSIKICTPPAVDFDWTINPISKCLNGIVDIYNLQCLQKPSDCNNYYIDESKVCAYSCPTNFDAYTDPVTNKKFCFRKTLMNKYLLNCGFSGVGYFAPKKSCMSNSDLSGCDMYLAKDSVGNSQCLPAPPSGWTQQSNTNVYNSPAGFKWETSDFFNGNCQGKVWDLVNIQCVADGASCGSLYYIREMNACVQACPNKYTATTDPNTNIKYCQPYAGVNQKYGRYILPVCDNHFILDFQNNRCLGNDGDCKGFIAYDSSNKKACLPYCPDGYTQGTNPSGVKTCQIPNGTNLYDLPMWSCQTTWDLKTLGCIADQNACTQLYGSQINVCFTACPINGELRVDSNNKNVCVIGPGPRDDTECQANQVQHTLQQKCLSGPQDCDNIIYTDDVTSMMICIPECPSTYQKITDQASGRSICKPPVGQTIKTTTLASCKSPNIMDIMTGNCINQASKCYGTYIKSLNMCISGCPTNYVNTVDAQGNLTCKFAGPGNNNKTMSCPDGTIADILNLKCLAKASDCNQYLLQDDSGFKQCVPECPFPYNIAKDPITGQLTCNPNSGQHVMDNTEMSGCQGIRSLSANRCLQDASQCIGIYLKFIRMCISQCPPDHVLRINIAGYITCAYEGPGNNEKLFMCEDPNLYPDFMGLKCLSKPEDCKGYYLTDSAGSKFCEPGCPPPFITAYDSVKNIQTCTPPTGKLVSDYPDMTTCQYVRDISTGKCLKQPSDCVGFYVRHIRMCLPFCPPDHLVRIDVSGAATCIYLSPGNNNKNVSCDSQNLYPDQMNVKCLTSPQQCDQYFLTDSTKSIQACIPACQSGYDQIKDANGTILCQPPSGQKIADNTTFINCQKIRQLNTGQCIDASQCSGVLLKFMRLCINQCPPGYTLKTDSAGNSTCKPPFKCIAPQILDVPTQTCLIGISSCTGVFIKDKMVCDATCPTNFKAQQDSNLGTQVCIPCYFTDSNNNCYETCPPPLFANTVTSKCISDISACTNYFTKALNLCSTSCPYGYTQVDTTVPKSCLPCSQNNSCSTQNTSLCQDKLSSDKSICAKDCPPGEMAQSKAAGLSYQQCQKCADNQYVSVDGASCVNACDPAQAINKATLRCIDPSLCLGVIYLDSNSKQWCVERCPAGLQTVKDVNTNISSCKPCDANTYFNVLTQKCENNCTIFDASNTFCLPDISYCKGYISPDQKLCQKQCASGKMRQLFIGQFQCLSGDCDFNNNEFYDAASNLCVQICPQGKYGGKDGNCTPIATCSGVYSYDGTNCLDSCPSRQYPENKKCKLCSQKISSDGLKCIAACATGELYDNDILQCVAQASCANKVVSADGKSCGNLCPPGQILSTDANGKKSCLNGLINCTQKISSDFTQCVAACNQNEIALTRNNLSICTVCPFGASDDGTSCKVDCPTGSILDVDQKSCITSAACGVANRYVTSDGKRCVGACVFPDRKRPSDSKNCYDSCDTNQVFDKAIGCKAVASCTDYVSSNNELCVANCYTINEIIDANASNPKKCRKCSKDENSSGTGANLICVARSDDESAESKKQAANLKSQIASIGTITDDLKKVIKDSIQQASQSIENSIKNATKNSSISASNKQQLILQLVQTIKDLALSFINALDTSLSNSATVNNNDKLSLGSDQYQLISEKKKNGFVFKTSFQLIDFFGANPPNLQIISSSVDLTKTNQVTNKYDSVSATNLAANPYCNDKAKCSTGLFQIDVKVSNKRFLQSGSSSDSFSLTYNVNSSQIDKTICVSYDSTGSMSPSSTSTNKANSQITCTFQSNSALYYDSSCQYVDQSLCPAPSNPTSTVVNTSPSYSRIIKSYLEIISFLIIILLI